MQCASWSATCKGWRYTLRPGWSWKFCSQHRSCSPSTSQSRISFHRAKSYSSSDCQARKWQRRFRSQWWLPLKQGTWFAMNWKYSLCNVESHKRKVLRQSFRFQFLDTISRFEEAVRTFCTTSQWPELSLVPPQIQSIREGLEGQRARQSSCKRSSEWHISWKLFYGGKSKSLKLIYPQRMTCNPKYLAVGNLCIKHPCGISHTQ